MPSSRPEPSTPTWQISERNFCPGPARSKRFMAAGTSSMSRELAIIDDDAGFAEALTAALSRKGVDATRFGSGEEFLQNKDWQSFPLVATDISMNAVDGVEMVLRMRKSGYLAPVILMTGHTKIDLSMFAQALKPYTLILKPFKIHELV